MPVEPPASEWRLPSPRDLPPGEEVAGVGADLEPGTLLEAYRTGLFPMPLHGRGPMGWWSPDPRGVLPLDGLRMSRSLRQSRARYEVRVDTAFVEVVAGCSDPTRPGGWITPEIQVAYAELHRLGWAHSIEVWDDAGIAGGLYGVAVGGLFAGESMFHRRRDASKVALVALVAMLDDGVSGRLLDVQWRTPHLASLGVVEVPREVYLDRLALARELPLPDVFG